jgi:hypothetical protein
MFYRGELPVRQYRWLCAKLAPYTYGDRARSQSAPLIRSFGFIDSASARVGPHRTESAYLGSTAQSFLSQHPHNTKLQGDHRCHAN